MKGIYLASFRAYHPGYDIVYQDINGKRDIAGDMLDVDLSPYDFVIASPPCNYWCKANYRRETSEYAQKTMHLLPGILDKLRNTNKPFIVENVINKKLMKKYDIFSKAKYVYFVGRHTYFSNVFIFDLYYLNGYQVKEDIVHISSSKRQGGYNVHIVINRFLEEISKGDYIK